jgi:acylphosphatase
MKKSVRLYIDGTVQDVFFRGFIKENAERHNVKGFVRNLEDGRVEIFLEGNNEDVDKVIELCKKGPKHAQIKGIEIRPEKFQDFKTFKILHI